MKKLLCVLLLAPSLALAAKAVSDPVDQRVTHCGVLLDANAKVTVPVTITSTVKTCEYQLPDSMANGSHSIRMTAIAIDPLWGQVESTQSAPLAFVRPAAPATPAGARLVP